VISYLTKKLFQNDGFTLIELLMVVIILGILAAVAIPQFSSSSTDAKIAALKSNLASIRGAIELYSVQHDDNYPSANIFDQLTLYTDKNGNTSTTKTAACKYGPYLKNPFPKMPFATVEAKAADIYADVTDPKAIGLIRTEDRTLLAGIADEGWVYVVATGEYIANHTDYEDL